MRFADIEDEERRASLAPAARANPDATADEGAYVDADPDMVVDEPLLDDLFDPNLVARLAAYATAIGGVLAAGWWSAHRIPARD